TIYHAVGFVTKKGPLPTEDSPEILKKIPDEVLHIIFRELPIPRMAELSLVSKQWSLSQQKFLNLAKPVFTTIMCSFNGSSVRNKNNFYEIKFDRDCIYIKHSNIVKDEWIVFDNAIPDIVIKQNWETGGCWDSAMIPGKRYPLGIEYCTVDEKLSDRHKLLMEKTAHHIRERVLPEDTRLRERFARYRRFPLLVAKQEVCSNDKILTGLKFYEKW
ncbi:MAG: hypothetical protein JSR46_11235, partial [Verrucomicrobia bacterium]|nr:hypothetical protein [Verrucomicrobiota bacterium]